MTKITDETIWLLVIGVFIVIDAFVTILSIIDKGIFKDRRKILLKKSNADLRKMLSGCKGVSNKNKADMVELILHHT